MVRDITDLKENLREQKAENKERKLFYYAKIETMQGDIHEIKEGMAELRGHIMRSPLARLPGGSHD